MPHNHSVPRNYAYTSSFFIIRTDFDEPKMVLHIHLKMKKLQMFGGHVEIGENLWETLVRELREETGYIPSQLKLLQPEPNHVNLPGVISHPTPLGITSGRYNMCEFEHFWTDTAFALVTDQEPAHNSDLGESKELYFLTESELKELEENEMEPMWSDLALKAFKHFKEQYQTDMDVHSIPL